MTHLSHLPAMDRRYAWAGATGTAEDPRDGS
jgi:hypothetical protein